MAGMLHRTHLTKERYHAARDLRRHRGPAVHHLANGLQQSLRGGLLEKVTRGARAKGLKDSVVVVIDGKNQQDKIRVRLPEVADPFNPRHSREPQIDQRHIGALRPQPRQSFLHAGEAARKGVPAGRVDQRGQAVPNVRLILHDDNADHW